MSGPGERGLPADASTAGGAAVTVVIPTRDRRALVQRALDSALRQDCTPDVVVVDDGGSDGTGDAVRNLGLPNVRLLRHERSRGVSAARNAGLAAVRTPWVAFLDDDDVWGPDKLRSQFAALDGTPGAGWSCVGAVHVDGSLRAQVLTAPPPSGDISRLMLQRPAVPGGGSGVLVETSLARDIGGFDEALSILADWDFYLRLSLRSAVAAVDSALLAYYIHLDSMYHDPAGVARELLLLRDKYRSLPDGRRFEPDLAHWFVRLARMAQQLGDSRGAAALLRRGVTEAGVVPVGVRLVRRLVRKIERETAGPARDDDSGWLAVYQGWQP